MEIKNPADALGGFAGSLMQGRVQEAAGLNVAQSARAPIVSLDAGRELQQQITRAPVTSLDAGASGQTGTAQAAAASDATGAATATGTAGMPDQSVPEQRTGSLINLNDLIGHLGDGSEHSQALQDKLRAMASQVSTTNPLRKEGLLRTADVDPSATNLDLIQNKMETMSILTNNALKNAAHTSDLINGLLSKQG